MSSRHDKNGTVSHRPLTRAEAKRLLEATLLDAADNSNQHSQQDETTSDSLPVEPPQQEATKRLDSTPTDGSHSGFENPFDRASPKCPPTEFSADPEYETMPYLYACYNGEADTEAHVHTFLTTWQAHHVSQRLASTDMNASRIAEFGLLLDGQATNWYSQHNITEFDEFEQLKDQFVQLFHHRIPQGKLMSHFYAITQEATKTIP